MGDPEWFFICEDISHPRALLKLKLKNDEFQTQTVDENHSPSYSP